MEFALTGPHQGKSVILGGFRFIDGVVELPDDAKEAHSLLRKFYGAHPSHLLVLDKDNNLVLKDGEDSKLSLAGAVPATGALAKPEQPDDLKELSKAELRVKASELGLSSEGSKDDLVTRIQAALKSTQ